MEAGNIYFGNSTATRRYRTLMATAEKTASAKHAHSSPRSASRAGRPITAAVTRRSVQQMQDSASPPVNWVANVFYDEDGNAAGTWSIFRSLEDGKQVSAPQALFLPFC